VTIELLHAGRQVDRYVHCNDCSFATFGCMAVGEMISDISIIKVGCSMWMTEVRFPLEARILTHVWVAYI
jgi:hypothetical protein